MRIIRIIAAKRHGFVYIETVRLVRNRNGFILQLFAIVTSLFRQNFDFNLIIIWRLIAMSISQIDQL